MGGISTLFVTPTPTPAAVPMSDGSGTLDDWVSNGSSGAGTGDVLGPASSFDGSLVIFDGITGKRIKQGIGPGVLVTNGSGVVSYYPYSAIPGAGLIPIANGSGKLDAWVSNGSGGNVFGPASAIDGGLAIFDGVTGKLLKGLPGNGVVIGSGSGVISYFPFSQTPSPFTIPISNGSSKLDLWITSGSGGTVNIQAALDTITSTRGSVLFRGPSAWQGLGPGYPGGYLVTNGSSADPSWSLGNGSGIFATWAAAVDAAGGNYKSDSKQLAYNLATALQAEPYFSKIIWLLPLLGGNLAAARVPLIDALGVGIATNTGFVEANFSQATGLQGGASKFLNSLLSPGAVSGVYGYGWWETNFTGSGNPESMGFNDTSPDNRFSLGLYPGQQTFFFGSVAALAYANLATAASNGHYYGQRASTTSRTLYKAGSSIATTAVSNATVPAHTGTIHVSGCNYQGTDFSYPGRCGVAYMTDGTLSAANVTALNTLLQNYLMTPTGRA